MINLLIKKVKTHLHSSRMEGKWRKLNNHNTTFLQWIPKDDDFFNVVKVGKYCYGPIRAIYSGHPNEKLLIGNFCSIGSGTTFILGSEHSYKTFTTFPFKVKCLGEKGEALTKGPIILEDDVWVGEDVMFLSGVKVGKGAVIAARSVVVKDIPPYSIVGGNPAKVIKYRVAQGIIDKLINIDLSKFDKNLVEENLYELYQNIDENNIDDIILKINGSFSN